MRRTPLEPVDLTGGEFAAVTLLQRVRAVAAEFEAQSKGEAPAETFFVAEQPGTTWAVMNGTPGPDFLIGSDSADTISGGDGDDSLWGMGGNDVLRGGTGADQLEGGEGDDRLYGDAGNDALIGREGNDRLYGGDGDDALFAYSGNDIMNGGSGNDTVYISFGQHYDVTVNLATGQLVRYDGTDTLVSIENVIAGLGNDTIYGDAAANRLQGEGGNDHIVGQGGDDLIFGGRGDDNLHGNDGDDYISGYWGNDFISAWSGNDIIVGGLGNDTITLVEGVAGADTLVFAAGDGHDTVTGFVPGQDSIQVTGFASFWLVQEGAHLRVVFDANNSILLQDTTAAAFQAGDINIPMVNVVTGTAGNDVLAATADDDRFEGGEGSDTVSFAAATAGVTIDLSVAGPQDTGGSGEDEFVSIENLTGSSFNDVLTGDAGNNILIGGAGNDILNGGDGDDVLIGGAGSDTLNGGAGVDTVSFANATGGVRVRLDDATPNAIYGFSTDTLSSVENIIGSAFDDYLYGDAGVNVIRGGAGNDFIIGRGGADFLYGEDGDDLFNLDNGDVAEGGAGEDTFITLSGHSVINDFTVGEDFLDALGYRTVNLVQEGDDVRVVFSANHSVLLKDITVAEIDPADFDFAITMHGSEDADILTGSGAYDYILGNGGDDVIVTGDGRNYAFGGEGNDHITGGASHDRLYGGAGDDVLVIGPGGADYLDGGAGNDTVSFEQASSYVRVTLGGSFSQDTRGGGNNVTLSSIEHVVGSDFNDFIYGNSDANVLDGGAGNDVLRGFGGDDVLIGGGGDTLVGGAGFDTADFSGAAGRLHLYLGNGGGYVDAGGVQFVYTSSIERVVGTAFNDYIRDDMTDSSDIVIEGGAGDDIIAALSGGQRTIAGGTGDDTIHLAYGAASVLQFAAGDGEDTIWGFTSGRDTIQVSGFASFTLVQEGPHLRVVFDEDNSILLRNVDKADFDVATDINIPLGINEIDGTAGDDVLQATGDDDRLDGMGGSDTASFAAASSGVTVDLTVTGPQDTGGSGVDELISIENLTGSGFDDTLTGDAGANTLIGLAGDDTLAGGAGDDTLVGHGGNDVLVGGTGNDILAGGDDADTIVFAAGDGHDTVYGFVSGEDAIDVTGFGSFDLQEFEYGIRLVFSATDSIYLFGVDREDFSLDDINIPLAINYVDGTAGDDVLLATGDDDRFDGMAGSDTVSFAGAASGVTVDLTVTGPQDTGGSGVDELISIENVIGSNFGDVITGDDGDNVLDGRQGYDVISGGGGDDVLSAQSGVLDGGSGDDTFDASGWFNAEIDLAAGTATGNYASVTLAGIENVQGGSSDDVILGDAGANALAGGAGDDHLAGRAGDDLLTGGAGADAFVFAAGHGHDTITDFAPGVDSIEVTGFTSYTLVQQGADLRIVFDANNSILLLNVDAAEFEAADINIPMLNEIDGTAGDDILLATAGDDRFDGMGGSDTASFAGAASGVTVDLTVTGPQDTGGSGHDELISIENLTGSGFDDVLTGDAGNNVLVGGAGDDILNGGVGDDVLIGGAGDDTFNGGDGVDTVDFSGSTTWIGINLGETRAQVTSEGADTFSSIEQVIGSGFGDTIIADYDTVRDIDHTFWGGAGDDSLLGGGGDDVLYGEADNDILVGDDGDDLLSGGAGNDDLHGGAGNDVLMGGAGADHLRGGDGANVLEGGAGDDVIVSYAGGADTLVFAAGDGHDTVHGFTPAEDSIQVSGFAGFTLVQEGADLRVVFDADNSILLVGVDRADFSSDDINIPLAINYVYGTEASEVLNGTAGDDVIYGLGGNDSISWSGGSDVLDGGAGVDAAIFGLAPEGVTVDLSIAGPQDIGPGMVSLISIESLFGSNYDDVLIGDDGDNTINGGLGADLLRGGGGYDRMYAGAGDRVYGDGGDDVVFITGVADVHGGSGTDLLWANGSSGLIADLTAGAVTFVGAGESGLLSGFENLAGSAHGDVLTGDAGANTLSGFDGNDVIDGAAGNDRIEGGLGDDILRGGEGDDSIATGGGDDTVDGGAGDDVITAGAGNLTISGGAGNDTLSFAMAASGVTVSLASASAQATGIGALILNGDVENLTGSGFNDRLTGNAVANTLTGGAGDDVLNGGSGADTTIGGMGDDWHFVDNANDRVFEFAGQGFDRVFASSSWALGAGMEVEILSTAFQDGTQAIDLTGNELANTIVGNNGVNILTGGAGDDRLLGHGGDDVLIGGAGDDRMDGGLGVDTADFHGATGAVTVNLATQSATGQGNDVLLDIENVMGSAFNDVLNGSAAANVLTGGAGDDRLDGRAGADTTFGGLGDDWHFVDNAGDVAEELSGQGFDRVFASTSYVLAAGAEIEILSTNLQAGLAAIDLTGNGFGQSIVGNQGANRLDGGAGDDVLMGHGGDDFLIGGLGNDRIDGGLGFDTVDFSAAAAGVNANLTTRIATGEGTDTLVDIERLVGTAFSDVLVGAAGANTLEGGAGDDRLDGRGGLDVTVGGLGNDWHYVDNAGDTVVELAGQGSADRVLASTSYVLAADAEIEVLSTTLQVGTAAIDLTGNALAQSIAGNDGVNRLDGGGGDDVLYGHGGDDVLIGGAGNDVLNGGLGNDTADYSAAASGISVNLATGVVTGGAGTDTLIGVENVTGSAFADLLAGDAGANILEGGAGDDTLTGGAGADVFLFQGTGTGVDRITDFTDGVDLIRFDGVAGVDDFSDLTIMGGNGPAGLGLRIVLPDGSTIYLQGVNAAQLSADDFIFGPG